MPKTVLLADDSVTIQHAVGISLANEDIALVNVGNGEDAVIKARAIKPDLILLDVVMPKLSGYEACMQIRQDPYIKHTPVIMLVGAIEGYDEQKFKDSKANDYVIKPFESSALISKIRKYLYPELTRTVIPPQPAVQPPVIPSPTVVPPIKPASTGTNPQIPIPPKPVVPPTVPPTIPVQNPVTAAIQNQPVSPPVPPIPPHIKSESTSPQQKLDVGSISSFIDNLISPPVESQKKVESLEMVDEISPQEIEEITSEIPELKEKVEQVAAPSVVDIVAQVEQSVGINSEPAPTIITNDQQVVEEPKSFNMEEWGKDLKKEIMEASGVVEQMPVTAIETESTPEKEMSKDIDSVAIAQPAEEPAQPMQVESIAESIITESIGEPVKAMDVQTTDSNIPAHVEPTSLVEQKIALGAPISEETTKQIREIVERVVWEIVPELAEKLIKEELKRLMSESEE